MEIDGTKFFLTWSRSDPLTNTMILEWLKTEFEELTYACVCEELHADGVAHHHAVVLLGKRLKRRTNCFKFDEFGCNVRRLRKNDDVKKAVRYTKKDGDYVEWGELPECCKKLDRREKAYFAIQHSNVECIDSGHFNFSELTRIQQIRNMFLSDWPQFEKREVKWFHGPTGCGKTRTAWEEFLKETDVKNVWISSGKIEPFMNGYVGQQCVILDDFRPGSCKFDLLLRLFDGYPVTVNVKGGTCNWMAKKIIVTAPIPPEEMYVNHETGETWDHLDQLLRRIDEIREFS